MPNSSFRQAGVVKVEPSHCKLCVQVAELFHAERLALLRCQQLVLLEGTTSLSIWPYLNSIVGSFDLVHTAFKAVSSSSTCRLIFVLSEMSANTLQTACDYSHYLHVFGGSLHQGLQHLPVLGALAPWHTVVRRAHSSRAALTGRETDQGWFPGQPAELATLQH